MKKNKAKFYNKISQYLLLVLDLIFLNMVLYVVFDNYINNIWITGLIGFLFIYEKIYYFRFDFWIDLKKIFKSFFLSFLIVSTIMFFYEKESVFNQVFQYFIVLYLLFPVFKRYSKKFLFRFSIFKININILANEPHKSQVLKEINSNWYLGLNYKKNNYQMLLISSKKYKRDKLEKIINRYSKSIKDIFVIPYIDTIDFSSSNVIDYSNIKLSAIHIESRLLNVKNITLKYIFEKFLVICVFPFALILHIFIAYLIKKDSKGSIFFKQKRLGKDGRLFRVYKYRTMYEDQEEILNNYLKQNPEEIEYYENYHKYKNDPRITNIGKFLRATSLDEFPQFYNVLRGDMNLIGPRPYMLNEKEEMGKANEYLILRVKPGITGLWQVSGRNDLTFERRVELEKWYIKNWSLWMDFVIFIKTIKVVLLKIGAK